MKARLMRSERGGVSLPWLALAPPASSAATTSAYPFCAAMMSGVTPSVLAEEKGGTQQGGAREPQAEREQ